MIDDDDPIPCWCGEQNPHFDDDPYLRRCGGDGVLYCHCGGDICVCHNHGEVDCPGCDDCIDEEEGDGWPEV